MALALPAWASQVKLDATVNATTITDEDVLNLTLTVTSDSSTINDEDPQLPDLKGFEIMNAVNSSSTSSIFDNGKFLLVRKNIYRYTLAPQKTGTYTIGSAEVKVNGEVIKSKPITIKVMAGGGGGIPNKNSNVAKNNRGRRGAPPSRQSQQPQGTDDEALGPFDDEEANDIFNQLLRRRGLTTNPRGGIRSAPQADTKDAFFIAVETNKKRVYVGEQIIASWYLYTRGGIQSYDALKYPELKGFWKEDLEIATRLSFQSEVVGGVPYNKALLVSYALFPIAPGKKNIDQYKAKATVIDLNSGMSVFGMGQAFTYVKASKEIPIDVIPLPAEGRPASFSGAVGTFNITGSVSTTQAKVNQPFSLKIRFSGEGNVKAIDLPPLTLPQNLEVYDTKKESQFQKTGEGFKEFEVLIIPRAQGNVTIPPIEVSYFDPKIAKYVTRKTPEFQVKVLAGDASQTGGNVPMAQGETPQTTASKDIKYLKTDANFRVPPKTQFIIWSVLFLTVWGWFAWQFWRLFVGGSYDQGAMARKKAKLKLKIARQKLKKGDFRGVGVETSNAVLSALGEVTGVGGASITLDELFMRLPPDTEKTQEGVRKFLNHCELVSFAPDELGSALRSESELKKVLHDAERLISELFAVEKKQGSFAPGASASADQKTS
jgi:hypothetical protein